MSDIHFNCLTIRGSAKGVAEFRKRNQGTETDENGKVVHCPLSFNALVPFPEKDLGIPIGGYAESLYHVLYSSDAEMFEDDGVRRARLKNRKSLAVFFRKKDEDAAGLAAQYRKNMKKHGHLTFLTWYPDKWGPDHDLGDGSEWNLSIEQVTPKELVYQFETNWGVPDGWLMSVAKLFPKLELTLAWEGADSMMTGLIVYRNGKQSTLVDRRMWPLEGEEPDCPSGSYFRYPEGPAPDPKAGTPRRTPRESVSAPTNTKQVVVKRRAAKIAPKSESAPARTRR